MAVFLCNFLDLMNLLRYIHLRSRFLYNELWGTDYRFKKFLKLLSTLYKSLQLEQVFAIMTTLKELLWQEN